MKRSLFVSIVAIILGLGIAGLGAAGVIWILKDHLLGHGIPVILICGVFVFLGGICILKGLRGIRSTN